ETNYKVEHQDNPARYQAAWLPAFDHVCQEKRTGEYAQQPGEEITKRANMLGEVKVLFAELAHDVVTISQVEAHCRPHYNHAPLEAADGCQVTIRHDIYAKDQQNG